MTIECGHVSLFLSFVFIFAVNAESRSVGRSSAARQQITPSLQPESSKEFLKDYPDDQRPGVDVLHFKHPYPVVQDNEDFDRDFVKDENSDNGSWKAQQEYDRLRHKLANEKREAADALEKKQKQEQELKNAVEKHSQSQAAKQSANKHRDRAEAAAAEKQSERAGEQQESSKSKGWLWSWNWWPWPWRNVGESEPVPKAVEEVSETEAATQKTEKAMDNLVECQKELARARDELERVMDETEKAKAEQAGANSVLEKSTQKELEAKQLADSMSDKEEAKKYAAAKAAYQTQMARVEQLKADVDAAAAKVKAYRDAEDADGGVYNSHLPSKGFAIPITSPKAFMLLLALVSSLQFS